MSTFLPLTIFVLTVDATTISTPTSSANNVSIFNVSAYGGDFSGDTIECGSMETCHIVCNEESGCEYMTINASMVANLVLGCGAQSACYGFNLQSPGPTNLSMTCNGTQSCRDGLIEMADTDQIDIYCDSNLTTDNTDTYSCRYLAVNAMNTKSFQMDCVAGCGDTDFQFQNVDSFYMRCAEESCAYGTVNISNAESVDIGCYTADDTLCLESAEFHFGNAGDIALDGISRFAFKWSHVYLYGDSGSFSMNCLSKTGCYGAEIYATNYESR